MSFTSSTLYCRNPSITAIRKTSPASKSRWTKLTVIVFAKSQRHSWQTHGKYSYDTVTVSDSQSNNSKHAGVGPYSQQEQDGQINDMIFNNEVQLYQDGQGDDDD